MRTSRVSRRGITLIELFVSILVISVMATFSVVSMSSNLSYFRARINAEQVAANVRLAQSFARSTNSVADATRYYGVALFPNRRVGGAAAQGFSYLLYRNNDPMITIADPGGAATVSTLNAAQATYLENLHPESVITQRWNPATPNANPIPLGLTRIAFGPDGSIEPTLSDLGNLQMNQPVAGSAPSRSYTFDIVNRAFGYVRVRIRRNGTVEQSGVNQLDQNPATQAGAAF